MSIASRIMKLFEVEIPFNKINVDCVLRKTAGDNNYKSALRHLMRKEQRIVLEQYDKDELVEMMLDAEFPADYNATIDEYYNNYMRNDVESIEDFVEFLDGALPKDLRS